LKNHSIEALNLSGTNKKIMESRYFGKKLFHFDRLDSTNSKAKEILKEQDLSEGSIVRCDSQIAGRGYSTNTWESETGKNITISYILKPLFLRPDKQFWITKILSLGVKQAVEHMLGNRNDIFIKWPNDIYAGNKKIAGILVENTIMAESITHCIAGIGLNINQAKFRSDALNPTSFFIESGKEYDLDYCLKTLSCYLEEWYNRLRREEYEQIDNNYLKSLYRIEKLSDFISDGKKFKGVIKGTDKYGRLIVMIPGKGQAFFDFKEIALVP
jgi:BirA family transcriptional regulator, biotin operon repressor / biotin---[acetyl-CoA-carboxylase] ligase